MGRARLFALVLAAAACPSASASCLVVEDSIAVGLGQALRGCVTAARVGLPSAAVTGRVRGGYGLTILSAESNDPTDQRLRSNLRAARAKSVGRVVWVLPRRAEAAGVGRAVAAGCGDAVRGFAPGRDGIHPRNYRALARSIPMAR